jgi:hypothetical protein
LSTVVQEGIKKERIKKLEYYLLWLHSNPDKVDPEVRPAAIDFVKGSIAELKAPQKENDRPGRRPSRLRTRLKVLLSLILTQN